MLKKLILLSILIPSITQAGLNGFTCHSRANCAGFNESISWDATHTWNLSTRSEHFRGYTLDHFIQTSKDWVKRSAAFDMWEGFGGWRVGGTHFRLYTDGVYHLEATEIVTDCSIYDGWWDWDGTP